MKLCVFFLVVFSAFGLSTEKAIPEGAEIGKFPELTSPPTVSQMADLGLSPIKLDKAWTGHNFWRSINRYVLETLKPGDTVLVDKNGVVRYRVSCGNKLVAITQCPLPSANSTSGKSDGKALNAGNESLGGSTAKEPIKPGLWSRLTGAVKDAAMGLWGLLALFWWLFLILLWLALLAVLAWLLAEGIRRLWQRRQRGPGPQVVPPVQPAVPPAPAPAPQPAPAPVLPIRPVAPAPQPGPGHQVVPQPAPAPAPDPAPAPAPQPTPVQAGDAEIHVMLGPKNQITWSGNIASFRYEGPGEGVTHSVTWETRR